MITGQENDDVYSFDRNTAKLSKCIEDRLVNKFEEDAEVARNIADLAARKFSGKTIERKALYSSVSSLLHYTRSKKSYIFNNSKLQPSQLSKIFKKTIEYCAEDESDTINSPAVVGDVIVSRQDSTQLRFTHNVTKLFECLIGHLTNVDLLYNDEYIAARLVSDIVAKKYAGKNETKKLCVKFIDRLFYNLRHNITSHSLNLNEMFLKLLKIEVKEALDACAEEMRDTRTVAVSHF